MQVAQRRHAIIRILIRHGCYSLSLLLGALLLSQLLFEAVPGDAGRRALGPYASQQSIEQFNEQMGLNRPIHERIANNLVAAIKLDFGQSLIDGRSVAPEVQQKFWVTFSLGLQAIFIALSLSLLLLVLTHFYPAASPLLLFSRAPSALPSFLSAVIVGLAAATWFPNLIYAGADWIPAPLLPSLVAAIYPASVLTTSLGSRFKALRTGSRYKAARAYGHTESELFIKALLVPSLTGILTIIVAQLSLVLFASLVIEIVFSLPGLGTLLLSAIQGHDYPMLQGILVINALVFIALHFSSEIASPLLDPRIAK